MILRVLPEEQSTKGDEHQHQTTGERSNNDGDDMIDIAVNENDNVYIMETDDKGC
jgi:hypothetical protein